LSDGNEFLTGTDPLDNNDVLGISGITKHSNQTTSIRWRSKSGKTYQLQGTESRTETNWTNVGERIKATKDEEEITIQDNNLGLFRVVLIQ
jgi:hypothetical protein